MMSKMAPQLSPFDEEYKVYVKMLRELDGNITVYGGYENHIVPRKMQEINYAVFVGTPVHLIELFNRHGEHMINVLPGLLNISRDGVTIEWINQDGYRSYDWNIHDNTPYVLFMNVADIDVVMLMPYSKFVSSRKFME